MTDKWSKRARGGHSTPDSSLQKVLPKQSSSASAKTQIYCPNEVDSHPSKLSEVRPLPAEFPPQVVQLKLRVLRVEAGTPPQTLHYAPALTAIFEVVVVKSGQKALAALQNDPFDVLHVNYSLPDMDGAEFLAHLRNVAGPVPIVIFS